jgi:hypothetical protein
MKLKSVMPKTNGGYIIQRAVIGPRVFDAGGLIAGSVKRAASFLAAVA